MSNMFSTNNNENKGTPSFKPGLMLPVILLIAAIVLVINCFTIVNEGFIGVKYQFGRIVGSNLDAGLRFKIPFIERIDQVDIRHQTYEFTGDAFTKDTQRVTELRLKLTYRYSQDRLSNIIKDTGISNVQDKFLVPNIQKFSKGAFGKVNAERLVQERDNVQGEIQEALTKVLAEHGIVVVEFAIENISFSDEFEKSIQAKVVAEQEALQMKNKTEERREEALQVVIKAEAEAESVILKAEAEARAIALIQEQIAQNAGYIEYLKIINWDGILPQVIGDGVNPFVVLGSDNTSGSNNKSSSNNQTE